jgi:uncharacterized OB-fold protein
MYNKMYTYFNRGQPRRSKGLCNVLDVRGYTHERHPAAVYQGLLNAGVFALLTCAHCSRAHYPPRVLCPYCGASSLGWRPSAGLGTVYSTSTISPRGGEPYAVILVDLDDGPRVMSNIVGMAADDVRIGMRVKVRVETREGAAIPLFEAVGAHER